ncbi:MAG: hypothetical protein ABEJ60_02950 [Halodesulfurarchaeum sp.]
MLPDLALTCTSCNADLTPADRKLTMRTPEGVRHAYECSCGAITITVSAESGRVLGEM